MVFFEWEDCLCGLIDMDESLQKTRELRYQAISTELSQQLKMPVDVSWQESGPPVRSDGLSISLSHKNEKLFFVTSHDSQVQVGCDLEYLPKSISWDLFKKKYYSQREQVALRLSGEQYTDHVKLLSLFSVKEAVYKCFGEQKEVLLDSEKDHQWTWKVLQWDEVSVVSEVKGDWIYSLCIG